MPPRWDRQAITDDSYDDLTLLVTTGRQGCCKAEWRLCLLWTDCCHVCGPNDRPAFILMPRLDDRSPQLPPALGVLASSWNVSKSQHALLWCLYIYVWFAKGTIFALSVGITFVRAPELAVSGNSVSTQRSARGRAKIGAVSRLTGSSLCGFWNSSPVCSLSLLSVEIHGALCVQEYTGEGNNLAVFFFLQIHVGDLK